MIIDRLILRNFKRFRDEEIHFRDGITGILGNNGTGKSSIVQAVFFGLYGVQATGIEADYIVSRFASPKDKCEVRLDFRIGGDEFSLMRTFKKGKAIQHDAGLYKGKKLLATGVSDVEREVRRILGMGPVDFRNTVYAAQKDLLTLLETTPGKRKEWFLKALGIEYLNSDSQAILKEQTDAKTSELFVLEAEIRNYKERLASDDKPRLLETISESKKAASDFENQRTASADKKAHLEQELRKFSDAKTEFTRLSERDRALTAEAHTLSRQQSDLVHKIESLDKIQPEFADLEAQLKGYPEKKNHFEALREKKHEFEKGSAELKFIRLSLTELATRVKTHEERLASLDADKKNAEAIAADIKDRLSLEPASSADLENHVRALSADIQHLSGGFLTEQKHLQAERTKILHDREKIRTAGKDGACPLCHQTLGEHFEDIEKEFEARLEAIEGRAVTLLAEEEAVSKKRSQVDAVTPHLKVLHSFLESEKNRPALEKEVQDLKESFAKRQEEEKNAVGKIAALKFDISTYVAADNELKNLEKVQLRYNELGKRIAEGTVLKGHVGAINEQITANRANLHSVQQALEQSAFDPLLGTNLESALGDQNAIIVGAEREIAKLTERIHFASEKIADINRAEEKLAILETTLAATKEEIELLKLIRTIIAEYVLYIMQVVRSSIEGEVGRILSDITGGRYEQVLLDEDFNLLIRDIDDDYPIERFSGGEQDDIAVALRIALSRYLAGLHNVHESTILIFDEIFGSQDEERRANLLTALRSLESRFPQIILISHVPEIHGEFANTLAVELGSDLASTVKEVE